MIKNNYQIITVNNASNGETIYTFLKKLSYSENYLKHLRKKFGFIKLNDNDCFINKNITIGDTISIIKNPFPPSKFKSYHMSLDIVYEDDDYLVVNKPHNLACIPTKSHYDNNLAGGIQNYMLKKDENFVCRIINRLDKDTAGLVIVAKNSLAAHKITNSKITKNYYAICEGKISAPLVINKTISTLRNEQGVIINKRAAGLKNGKQAKTIIQPIKQYKDYTLIKINLEHGRTHQIRCHLSSINHALLGDELYGKKSDLINHTALICKEMSFMHPFLNIEVNLSIDFSQPIKKLI